MWDDPAMFRHGTLAEVGYELFDLARAWVKFARAQGRLRPGRVRQSEGIS